MRIIKRQDVEINLPHQVENWNLDLGNGVLVMTRALYEEDLAQLAETGKLDIPEEIVIYIKPGHAVLLTPKEDSTPEISSIFPSLDGDLAVDIILEIQEVRFMEVPVVEE